MLQEYALEVFQVISVCHVSKQSENFPGNAERYAQQSILVQAAATGTRLFWRHVYLAALCLLRRRWLPKLRWLPRYGSVNIAVANPMLARSEILSPAEGQRITASQLLYPQTL